MTRPRHISFAAAAFLLVSAVPAAFAEEFDTHTAQVSLKPASLATQAGQRAVRARVMHAAATVCGTADTRDLSAMADVAACREAAFSQGMSEVEIATAALHAHPSAGAVVSASAR